MASISEGFGERCQPFGEVVGFSVDLDSVDAVHAAEVTGFVNEGMPAMMRPGGMMGPGGMMRPR